MSGLIIDDSKVEAQWFDHESGWRVNLRLATLEAIKDIRKQTVRKKVDYKKVEGTASRFEFDETDDEKQSKMLWDFCIVGWEGIKDKDGNDVPCNQDMKYYLMNRSALFQTFVSKCMKTLNEVEEERQKELEKN
jgi:hypothetical protein